MLITFKKNIFSRFCALSYPKSWMCMKQKHEENGLHGNIAIYALYGSTFEAISKR